jgi:hypothetical protein
MAAQLLDKPEAENGRLAGMMKDMETNQASIEVLVSSIALLSFHSGSVFRYRNSIYRD